MSSLSCPSAAVCNATDPNGILRTADSGKKWVNQVLPTGVTSVGYLSCPSASTCMAGGSLGQGAVTVHTTDAGARWAAVDLPTGISQLDAVACRAASVCEAGGTISAGYGIERTTNGGTAWVNQTLMYTPTTPFGSGQLSSIAVLQGVGLRCRYDGELHLPYQRWRDQMGRRQDSPLRLRPEGSHVPVDLGLL